MAGQDLGLQYSLSIVKRDGDLVLIGTSNTARNAIAIGRTHSISSSFSRSFWSRLAVYQRTFNSKTLGHVYLCCAPTNLQTLLLPLFGRLYKWFRVRKARKFPQGSEERSCYSVL